MRCPDSSAALGTIGRSGPRTRAEEILMGPYGALRRLLKRLQHRMYPAIQQQWARSGRGIRIRRADRRQVSVTRYNIFLRGEMGPPRDGSPWAQPAPRSPGHTLGPIL